MKRRPILFTVLQTGAAANGGVASISKVMLGLRDYRPVVLTNRDSESVRSWCDAGIATQIVPEAVTDGIRHDPLGYLQSYYRYYLAVRRLIRATGATIVHANDPAAFQLSLAGARARKVKIILNLRDTLDPERRPPSARYRQLFRAADHMFFLSGEMADQWKSVAANAAHSFNVTYSIVDLERFRPSPAPKSRLPAVLLSGLVCPKKGQLEFLLNTAPLLVEHGVRICFVGDFDPATSSYAAACAEAARPFGEFVRFLGYRRDLPELINEAGVVVVASRHEGLVRSMIEAMSCGRPVVSTPVCSAREMLEVESDGAGTVVEFGDHAGMAAAIMGYLGDEPSATRAGNAGRETAQRLFGREAVIGRYEHAYRTLSGGAGAA